MQGLEIGGMTPQVRALVALPGDLSSAPRTHVMGHNPLELQFQGS